MSLAIGLVAIGVLIVLGIVIAYVMGGDDEK